MSKTLASSKLTIVTQNFTNDNTFAVDFAVGKDTFSNLRDRITEQYFG
jgi:hypothetical protein